MFRPQRTTSPGHAVTSWSLRIPLLLLVLISFVPLGFGIMTVIPQGRFADVARAGSALWQRVSVAMPAFQHPEQLVIPVVTSTIAANSPPAPAVVTDAAGPAPIVYGDRLKISFFETLGVALDASTNGANQTVASVFPRMDLSGEYTVDEAGVIDIPRLGQLTAAGQTIEALQSALASRFDRAFGRQTDVHAAIIDREPIYVTGNVRTAGAFKYAVGMIVLQALADAGGSNRSVTDTSRDVERIREIANLHAAQGKLDALRIKQAGLVARRDKLEAIVVPEDIRSRLGDKRVQDVLAGATAALSLERKGRQQEIELAERRVGVTQLEVDAQQLRIDQSKDLISRKREKLRETEMIAARGSVSQYKLIDMGAEISELEAKQEDLRAALAQAQRQLIEALSAEAHIKFDNSLNVQQELAATAQDIDDCRQSIASMEAVVQVLQGGNPSASSGRPSLKIARKMRGHFSVLQANEMTPLQPGDVLQVDTESAIERPL